MIVVMCLVTMGKELVNRTLGTMLGLSKLVLLIATPELLDSIQVIGLVD